MQWKAYLHLTWRLIILVRNWPIYFKNRFCLVQGDIHYKLRNGLCITSRPFHTDGGALNDVWFEESYEPKKFHIPFNWNACKTIIDIGANIGTFSLYAAVHAPHSSIIAIEPEPQNNSYLRQNIAANKFSERIKIIEAAIGDSDGSTTLHVSHRCSGGHSRFHAFGESHTITVPMRSLLSLMRDHAIMECDYLKLDCEGGEYDALYNLPQDMLRRIRFMAVEYHHFSSDPRHNPLSLQAYLREQGWIVAPGKKSMFFAWQK